MKLTERLGKEWIFFDGGMGTILFTAGGILLMGAALILVVAIRRKRPAAEE